MSAHVDVFADGFTLGNRKPRRSSASYSTQQRSASRPSAHNDTAAAALSFRASERPTTAPSRMVRDFTRVNKQAVSKGLVTAKEHQRFRELNTGWRPPSRQAAGRRSRSVALPGSDHVYGKPSRETEDISEVLAYKPGRTWLETRHAEMLQDDLHESSVRKGCRLSQPTTTRTAVLRRKEPSRTTMDSPDWQISKYGSASPQVSTFRSSEARNRALRKQQREAPANAGRKFGQGIPNNPAGTYRNL